MILRVDVIADAVMGARRCTLDAVHAGIEKTHRREHAAETGHELHARDDQGDVPAFHGQPFACL